MNGEENRRPRLSAINALAATMLARELVARIPGYAEFVKREGPDALAQRVAEASRSYRPRCHEETELAAHIEALTLVGAPERTKALVSGFGRLHEDASVLLHQGWIREVALQAPFEGDFAKVSVGSREGHAFRHPDLDARAMSMFVRSRDGLVGRERGELVRWEQIGGVQPPSDEDRPHLVARHKHMNLMAGRPDRNAPPNEAEVDRKFAEAMFREISPKEREYMVDSLAEDLYHSSVEGWNEQVFHDSLNGLAGVSAAMSTVSNPWGRKEEPSATEDHPAPRM
jgi:hypothetical protein